MGFTDDTPRNDILDLGGVETLSIPSTILESINRYSTADFAGHAAFWRFRDAKNLKRAEMIKIIAKTLIISGRYDWEEIGGALAIAISEFDRMSKQEKNKKRRWG